MARSKKINNFTLDKMLRDFKKEALAGGRKDVTQVLMPYPGGEGTLVFRMKLDSKNRANGYFIFRFTPPSGGSDKIPIGRYVTGERGFAEANAATEDHRSKLRQGVNPKEKGVKSKPGHKRPATFKDVVRFYIYYQVETKKVDAENVRRELERHVLSRYKNLLAKDATDITETNIENIIKGMVEKGIGRSSNRVKTYLTTAYNKAKKRSGQMASLRSKGFPDVDFSKIRINPAADVGTDPDFENTSDNDMTEAQLKQFYKSITLDQNHKKKFMMDAATFYFITMDIALGGQRKRQLINVTWDSVDMDDRVIQIIDRKGTKALERPYIIPLNNLAFKCLEMLREITGGQGSIYPFSESYVPKELREYSEWKGTTVRYAGLRSTCTTLMKRKLDYTVNDYDKEDVKRIQNHKIEGVQARHYDKNDYWDNKKKLIERWGDYLESIGVWA